MQRSNPIVDAFYHSKEWKKTRQAYIKHKLGICERCGQPHYFVHHKEYITVDNINNYNITLNWDNLELLCKTCHIQEHFKEKQEYVFDEKGDIIKNENK